MDLPREVLIQTELNRISDFIGITTLTDEVDRGKLPVDSWVPAGGAGK